MALVVFSLLLSLAFIEGAYRIAAGLSLFKLANWRLEQVMINRLGDRAIFDPEVGWTLRAGYVSDDFNVLDHGIRRNFDETTIRTGGLLAVGDSFTEGWEDARDEETWPAQLERLIGTPVVNGGVGGYATDQIILRVEQLLPVVRPKTLIIGFVDIDIFRTGHAPFGAPKPHFTIERGELRYHPPEPIDRQPSQAFLASAGYALRDVLGYSAVLDFFFSRWALNYWYGDGRQVYRRVHYDEIAVTCALLKRLKQRTDKDGIRTVLFMQYYAALVLAEDEPSDEAQAVMACAIKAGIEVVDQFGSLRAMAKANPDALRAYYNTHGGLFGHMLVKGNEHAAKLLARALADR